MIVSLLVLLAILLSVVAIIISFYPRRRVSPLNGNSGIDNATQLDAAIAIQRSERVRVLQHRTTDRNILPFTLLCVASLMQIGALAVDHMAHASIAVLTMLPVFFVVLTARGSRRREARRQLDALVRSDSTSPIA